MYKVVFGNSYIIVSSKELEEELKKLINFVIYGEKIDIREALKTIHYLKKYKSNNRSAVLLVKLAEKKILEILKNSNVSLW